MKIRLILLLFMTAFLFSGKLCDATEVQDISIPVSVDQRVELISIIFRLAGANEGSIQPGNQYILNYLKSK